LRSGNYILGSDRKKKRGLPTFAVFVLGAFTGFLVAWFMLSPSGDEQTEVAADALNDDTGIAANEAADATEQGAEGKGGAQAAGNTARAIAPQPAPAPQAIELPEGMEYVGGEVSHSLYRSLSAQFPDEEQSSLLAEKLAAHLKRLLIFDLNPRKHLRKGDHFDILYKLTDDSTDGVRILAARFQSQYHKKTFEAYFHKGDSDTFGHHYDRDGVEVQKRLKNGPLKDFEQVTALLKDRRPRHDGVDLKAPVNTPIYLPFDAKVMRKNWSTRSNGNCLDLRYRHDGTQALMLHLEKFPAGIEAGKVYKKGTHIANVGNTGRSMAAHLHYQIEKPPGRVFDPYKYHGSTKLSLKGESKKGFESELSKFDRWFEIGAVSEEVAENAPSARE